MTRVGQAGHGAVSGPHEARDCLGGFFDLPLGLWAAGSGCIDDAVLEMVVRETHCDAAKSTGHGTDLGEDVDALLLLLDHAVNASRLALDPAQPRQVPVLL